MGDLKRDGEMACTMLVIRNAACLCPMDPERRVILDNGAVAARNGRIIAVGTNDDIDEVLKTYASSGEEVESIDARNMLVLPGLVDAHGHAGHGLLKTLGYGKYNSWLYATRNIYSRGSTEAFWEAEASLCALERLKFGITTAFLSSVLTCSERTTYDTVWRIVMAFRE